jgi:hypothetical protein
MVAVGVAASSHAAAVVRVCASCGQGVCNAQRCASPVHGLCTRPGGLSTASFYAAWCVVGVTLAVKATADVHGLVNRENGKNRALSFCEQSITSAFPVCTA